jgi:2-methylisocitrate lyase-like PEP mutase family enzyme
MARTFKVVLVALVVLALAGSAYAFAAANTIAVSGAGYKASTIGGYAVTNVVYDLNDTDPTKLSKVIFDIAPVEPNTAKAVTVKISTTISSAPNYTASTCVITGTSPVVATCSFTADIDVDDVVALDIAASSSLNPGP